MQSPFGVLENMFKTTENKAKRNSTQIIIFDEEFVKKMEPFKIEEKMSSSIDVYLRNKGFRQINWARLCFTVTVINTVLNLFAGLYRADFLNITVCAVAIFLLTNPEMVEKTSFRLLVAGTFLSLVYDIVWRCMQDFDAEELADCGLQQSVHIFSYWVLWVMMLIKIVMGFVYWKASLDFAAIIDERSVLIR
jgi:hypothetical protein